MPLNQTFEIYILPNFFLSIDDENIDIEKAK